MPRVCFEVPGFRSHLVSIREGFSLCLSQWLFVLIVYKALFNVLTTPPAQAYLGSSSRLEIVLEQIHALVMNNHIYKTNEMRIYHIITYIFE